MASGSGSLFGTIVIGLITAVVAAEVLDFIGGANLNVGPASAQQLAGHGVEGLYRVKAPIQNRGLFSGSIQSAWAEALDGSGVVVEVTDVDHERIFPFERRIVTTELLLHRRQGRLPDRLSLHYKTANGEELKQELSLVCEHGQPSLQDTMMLLVARGRADLEGSCVDVS